MLTIEENLLLETIQKITNPQLQQEIITKLLNARKV